MTCKYGMSVVISERNKLLHIFREVFDQFEKLNVFTYSFEREAFFFCYRLMKETFSAELNDGVEKYQIICYKEIFELFYDERL